MGVIHPHDLLPGYDRAADNVSSWITLGGCCSLLCFACFTTEYEDVIVTAQYRQRNKLPNSVRNEN